MKQFSNKNTKINPTKNRKIDGSINDNQRVEIGPSQLAFNEWQKLKIIPPNLETMRQDRFNRILKYLRKHDYAGILLFDPLNIRYASDCSNMQVWIMHNFARACFIGIDGNCVLWDFHNCEHLSEHLPLVKEVRHGASFFYFECGDRVEEKAKAFATEIDSLMQQSGGTNRRLAVDKIEVAGLWALQNLGLQIFEGQELMEHARSVKGEAEICAMRCAIASCDAAMNEMKNAMQAGISEVELWSHLHAGNIKRGGEWIETRLMSSGPRTNPWFQECGPRIIDDGDIVAFDTDLVGVYGMCCDISRTWLCGDAPPNPEQKQLYQVAHEHISKNIELLKPDLSFLEYTQIADQLPEIYRPLRYGCFAHGVGLCDEFPVLRYHEDVKAWGYDGVFKPNMVISVEAYVGEVGGKEGVKLEEQILITKTGYERLSNYPFETAFLT